MKRKLWIYGCSYSDFWGDKGNRDDNSWVRILEKELDLECTHHTIDKDNREWELLYTKHYTIQQSRVYVISQAVTDSHIIENLFLKIVLNGNHKILLL